MTNAALIVFTMQLDYLISRSQMFQYWVFIGFQWVVFLIQMLFAQLIPDVPIEVDIQMQRQNFIVRRMIFMEVLHACMRLIVICVACYMSHTPPRIFHVISVVVVVVVVVFVVVFVEA